MAPSAPSRPKRLPLLWAFRTVAWGLGLWPALELGWRIVQQQLGANPVEAVSHLTGIWALRLLLLTLAMTPLRQLTGRVEFVQVRRLLGLWVYAWVCVHFAVYLTLDLQWSLPTLAEDLVERRYLTVGFAAWMILLPLTVTSTPGWQRRLKRNWKRLHRLVYIAAMLGVLHFIWLVKSDLREPLLYAAILAVLLGFRVARSWRSGVAVAAN